MTNPLPRPARPPRLHPTAGPAPTHNHPDTAPPGTPGLWVLAGGLPSHGSADGTGAQARFYSPMGLALDPAGNLYVADQGNHMVRKVTPAGVVTTLAGCPSAKGSVDGTGAAASFDTPSHLAMDGQGNLFVTDFNAHNIRKVTPQGVVSTVAGLAGVAGSADGAGSDARFNGPSGIQVGASGNLYVVDSNNNTLRLVTPQGAVSTLAGTAGQQGTDDGAGAAARFKAPVGLARDTAGNLFVADGSLTIRKITPTGQVSTLAGAPYQFGHSDGTGSSARFSCPFDITLDAAGNLLVTDSIALRKVTALGVVSTLAGGVIGNGIADGPAAVASFNGLAGVAVAGDGTIHLVDNGSGTLRNLSPAGQVSTLAGQGRPLGSKDGTGLAALFHEPDSLALDRLGHLYIAEDGNGTIRKMTRDGQVTTLAGLSGQIGSADGTGSNARFGSTVYLAVDDAGNALVSDHDNDTIRKITPKGVVTTVAGLAGSSGSTDGLGSAARFHRPCQLAVTGAGVLFVVDAGNHTIRRITPDGQVSTFAGMAGQAGSADGAGSDARFNDPQGITADQAGNLFVTDYGNNTIRRITPSGVVSTLAGTAGTSGSADGLGAAASFNSPCDLAVDDAGNLYVADGDNGTLRMITAAGMVTTKVGVTGTCTTATGPLPASLCVSGVAVDPRTGELFLSAPNAILTAR